MVAPPHQRDLRRRVGLSKRVESGEGEDEVTESVGSDDHDPRHIVDQPAHDPPDMARPAATGPHRTLWPTSIASRDPPTTGRTRSAFPASHKAPTVHCEVNRSPVTTPAAAPASAAAADVGSADTRPRVSAARNVSPAPVARSSAVGRANVRRDGSPRSTITAPVPIEGDGSDPCPGEREDASAMMDDLFRPSRSPVQLMAAEQRYQLRPVRLHHRGCHTPVPGQSVGIHGHQYATVDLPADGVDHGVTDGTPAIVRDDQGVSVRRQILESCLDPGRYFLVGRSARSLIHSRQERPVNAHPVQDRGLPARTDDHIPKPDTEVRQYG